MSGNYTVLSGIGYTVSVVDRQVIFESAHNIWGHHTKFAFERPIDLNNTGGIWYFVHMDSSTDRVVASHIVEALAYCEREFGASFEPYRGALELKTP